MITFKQFQDYLISLFLFVDDYRNYREYVGVSRHKFITITIYVLDCINALVFFLFIKNNFSRIPNVDIEFSLFFFSIISLWLSSYSNKKKKTTISASFALLSLVFLISFCQLSNLLYGDYSYYVLNILPILISGFIAPTFYPILVSVIISVFTFVTFPDLMAYQLPFVIVYLSVGIFNSFLTNRLRYITKELIYEKKKNKTNEFAAQALIRLHSARNQHDAVRLLISKLFQTEQVKWVFVTIDNEKFFRNSINNESKIEKEQERTLISISKGLALDRVHLFPSHYCGNTITEMADPFFYNNILVYKATDRRNKMLSIFIGYHSSLSSIEINTITRILSGVPRILDKFEYSDELSHNYQGIKSAYNNLLIVLSKASDLRDSDTQGHAERTTIMVYELAQKMNIHGDLLRQIYEGALIHDVGKIGIPDNILLKEAGLNEEERKIIKEHPKMSLDILKNSDYLMEISDIPLYHHEWWNGQGYPFGLKGESIPLSARIFAVIDVWDALTNQRSYKKAFHPERAIEIILSESGTHFDPNVVKVFVDYLDEKKIINKRNVKTMPR